MFLAEELTEELQYKNTLTEELQYKTVTPFWGWVWAWLPNF